MRVEEYRPVARAPAPWRVIPDGTGHLLVHCYDSGERRCLLVGPRSVYHDVDRRGRARTVVVRFRAGMLAALGRAPAVALRDAAVDVRDAWPAEAGRLADDLAAAADGAAVVRVVDALLLRRLRSAAPVPPAVLAAVRRGEALGGRCSAGELAAAAGTSERQLRALFDRHVGLSPKRFLRVVRVTNVVRGMTGRDPGAVAGGWAGRAAAHGYFDQAHLIHDCEALLGESPERFRQRLDRE